MAVGRFSFSAAPTAQNSPELNFRFLNSFIQPSRVGSLALIFNSSLSELRQVANCNTQLSLISKIDMKSMIVHTSSIFLFQPICLIEILI